MFASTPFVVSLSSFFAVILKNYLPSFCWILSFLPSTTRVFCKKSCYIKLRGLDSLIFPLFISKFELNFLHWSVWFWFGSELHILICFFLNFFYSMNSYFVFYWIVKLLWYFFFAMLLGAYIWYLHHIHVLDWLDIKTVSHHLIKALNCHILKQTAPSSKKIYSLRKRFFPFLLGK